MRKKDLSLTEHVIAGCSRCCKKYFPRNTKMYSYLLTVCWQPGLLGHLFAVQVYKIQLFLRTTPCTH